MCLRQKVKVLIKCPSSVFDIIWWSHHQLRLMRGSYVAVVDSVWNCWQCHYMLWHLISYLSGNILCKRKQMAGANANASWIAYLVFGLWTCRDNKHFKKITNKQCFCEGFFADYLKYWKDYSMFEHLVVVCLATRMRCFTDYSDVHSCPPSHS